MKTPAPTLTAIADRIDAHLKRLEASREDNTRYGGEKGTRKYYLARAYRGGRYACCVYVSYQIHTTLDRGEAVAYLEWLDSGGNGTWYDYRCARDGAA